MYDHQTFIWMIAVMTLAEWVSSDSESHELSDLQT